MRKKIVIVSLIVIFALTSLLAFAGCNSKLDENDAWEAFNSALAKSEEHLQNKGNYFIKCRYNGKNDKGESAVITQKLNVVYGNSNIKDWEDFVVADRGVEKASKFTTDYLNSYFGYSLKSGVKAKKATKEDYALGYFNTKGVFTASDNVQDFFNLKAGDTYNGNTIDEDTETYKYTLEYALGTLDGINQDTADIISAEKSGNVVTLKIVLKLTGASPVIVRITVGRISKISYEDANLPIYFINYAGPNLTLASYDKKLDEKK